MLDVVRDALKRLDPDNTGEVDSHRLVSEIDRLAVQENSEGSQDGDSSAAQRQLADDLARRGIKLKTEEVAELLTSLTGPGTLSNTRTTEAAATTTVPQAAQHDWIDESSIMPLNESLGARNGANQRIPLDASTPAKPGLRGLASRPGARFNRSPTSDTVFRRRISGGIQSDQQPVSNQQQSALDAQLMSDQVQRLQVRERDLDQQVSANEQELALLRTRLEEADAEISALRKLQNDHELQEHGTRDTVSSLEHRLEEVQHNLEAKTKELAQVKGLAARRAERLELDEREITSLQEQLAASNAQVETLTTDRAAHRDEPTALETVVHTKDEELAKMSARIAELEASEALHIQEIELLRNSDAPRAGSSGEQPTTLEAAVNQQEQKSGNTASQYLRLGRELVLQKELIDRLFAVSAKRSKLKNDTAATAAATTTTHQRGSALGLGGASIISILLYTLVAILFGLLLARSQLAEQRAWHDANHIDFNLDGLHLPWWEDGPYVIRAIGFWLDTKLSAGAWPV
ncbi:hypothetical protein PYCC9005_002223 [Savitreella phatthalungensis]